uniref:Lethal(3)malignant brain tumor-like protein 3 isoform X2 n=1 Tax=Petromyzon marinus TaxID=7757 RepID=A0AAJ7TJ05_PETMA|nr:lethal(3)malignant brain tumor-like protein 3 isoform X2 [Petromyzon marinus]
MESAPDKPHADEIPPTDAASSKEVQVKLEAEEGSLPDSPLGSDGAVPSHPDFDVVGAMDWRDGIGTLPGSTLRFRINEFGTLEIVSPEESAAMEGSWNAGQGGPPGEGVGRPKEEPPGGAEELPSMEGICCCEQCGHYGTAEEFFQEGRFCSDKCARIFTTEKPGQVSSVDTRASDAKKRGRKLSLNTRADPELMSNGDDRLEKRGDLKMKIKVPSPVEAPIKLRRHSEAASTTKKRAWTWMLYLEEDKGVAAPVRLFRESQSFPQSRNGFKVGMRLEGIDPKHPSLVCVLSVAEVCGYRVRLHFDGYSECYDFWVNADSPDIHPVGWCEKTNHKLQPPKGHKEEEFAWPAYLKTVKAQAAPRQLFKNQNTTVTPMGFRVGMKLEAVDKKNPALVCVATITDVVDSRFLVHFDTWDDSYDYWCDSSSPYIHPVGWCQEHGRPLTPPQNYSEGKKFSWEKYLEENGAQAAPARAFKQRPTHGFQPGMRLEAVDRRNPTLVCVATIANCDDHRIKVHFDGWSPEYNYWLDADCPDIHPVGWCEKTGHPLQLPVSSVELVSSPGPGGCPTPGCKGIGHIKGAKYTRHHSAFGCPYSELNMNKETSLQDRLGGGSTSGGGERTPGPAGPPRPRRLDSTGSNGSTDGTRPASGIDIPGTGRGGLSAEPDPDDPGAPSEPPSPPSPEDDAASPLSKKASLMSPSRGRKPKLYGRVGRPPKYLKLKREQELAQQREAKEREEHCLQQTLHQSVFMSALSAHPARELPLVWQQHGKLLPEVAGLTASRVASWGTEEVAMMHAINSRTNLPHPTEPPHGTAWHCTALMQNNMTTHCSTTLASNDASAQLLQLVKLPIYIHRKFSDLIFTKYAN